MAKIRIDTDQIAKIIRYAADMQTAIAMLASYFKNIDQSFDHEYFKKLIGEWTPG